MRIGLCYLSNLKRKTSRFCNYDVCSLLLQGCSHDRGTSNAESNECGTGALLEDSICNGSASTAYGWRSPTGTFRTVMAYFCQPGQCDNYQGTGDCFRIPYFSGDYDYRNGETLGGEQNNCRKEIMKNKRKIAAYRWPESLHQIDVSIIIAVKLLSSRANKSFNFLFYANSKHSFSCHLPLQGFTD